MPAKPRNTDTITFSLPPEMARQLRQVVKEEDRTVSELLREAIRLYMEEREWRTRERLECQLRVQLDPPCFIAQRFCQCALCSLASPLLPLSPGPRASGLVVWRVPPRRPSMLFAPLPVATVNSVMR